MYATPTTPENLDERLDDYARLLIGTGCNLQPGQELYLGSDVANIALARKVVARAYEAGASDVLVHFTDEEVARMGYENRPLQAFEEFPDWLALQRNGAAKRGAALLFLDSEDPFGMKDVDPRKFAARIRAAEEACKDWRRGMDFGHNVWCIAGASAPSWAARVFPDLSESEAVMRLWDAIFATVYLGEGDAAATWMAREDAFKQRMSWLNGLGLDRLHYTNALGTDLVVGLNERGLWEGGGTTTTGGTFFFPNMPTEEVFSSPNRAKVDGIVYSALPLNHDGTVIDKFWIRFKAGRAIDFGAEVGEDALRGILETDEGARYLGECALVPKESPIRTSGVLFLSTLYDENAACHLALGVGFPECLEGGLEMEKDELLAAGVNQSATHVDFMIGTDDLSIVGTTRDGREVAIFKNGTWA